MHKGLLLLVGCLLIAVMADSQVPVLIKIFDRASGKPLSYGNGRLHADRTSVNRSFVFSEKGTYELEKISPGKYSLSISCLGYTPKDTTIEVADKRMELNIFLSGGYGDLQEVKVQAEKPYLEMDKGKFIVNVQQSALAKSNSAWDALKYAPTVLTDATGSLTVMNKPATVFIDGRRLHLSGEALMQYLQGISASHVDKIEVAGHPDASYAADVSSVVKISTIRSKEDGIKGDLNVRGLASSFFNASSGANLEYKKEKFYLQAGYAYNFIKSRVLNHYGLPAKKGSDWEIPQKTVTSSSNNRFFTTLGYDFSKNNKLTFYMDLPFTVSATGLSADNGPNTAERSDKDSIFRFRSNADIHSHSFQSQLTYQTIFDKERQHMKFELEYFDNDRRYKNAYQSQVYDFGVQHYVSAFQRVDLLPQRLHTFIGSVTNGSKFLGADFSYGVRYTENSVFNDNATYDRSNAPQSLLAAQKVNYFEKNYAAFSSWEKQLNSLYIQLGLRMERNIIESETDSLDATATAAVGYKGVNFFPNLLFQYSRSDSSYWVLSFNKSFKRPDYFLLNPYHRFTNNSAARFEGNSSIRPQKNFDISLGWTNNHNITIYTGYLIYKDMISTLYLKDSVSGNLFQKYDNFYLHGAYITATYAINLRNWWRASFDGYGLFFKTRYKKIPPGKFSPIISANLSNEFTINPRTQIGINVYFKPTYSDGYFTHYGQGNVNFAVTEKIKNTNIAVSLFGNDLFKNDGYKEKALYDIHYIESGYLDTRQFGVSFVWRFGKQSVKNQKVDRLESDDSKNRL